MSYVCSNDHGTYILKTKTYSSTCISSSDKNALLLNHESMSRYKFKHRLIVVTHISNAVHTLWTTCIFYITTEYSWKHYVLFWWRHFTSRLNSICRQFKVTLSGNVERTLVFHNSERAFSGRPVMLQWDKIAYVITS